jgi:hypothetical protein
MLFALCLIVCFSSVLAQKPTPCQTPPQWEARYTGYDSVKKDYVRAHLTYDAVYKRERVIEERVLGSDKEFYDVLYLHNQGIEYRVDLKTKNCTKQSITRPWVNFGIPANATSFGESYLGSSAVPNANVLASLWGLQFVDTRGDKIDYFGVWTYEACLPVHVRYVAEDAQFDIVYNFFDIVPGKCFFINDFLSIFGFLIELNLFKKVSRIHLSLFPRKVVNKHVIF